MAALKLLCIFSAAAVLVSGQGNGHHNEVPSAGEVDHAIVDISMHYSEALCLELLLVDCATHVTQGDEKVCGSNGHTYANHCKFVHAVCEFAHSNPKLTLASHGECPVAPTSSMTTVHLVATAAPVTATTSVITGAQSSSVTTHASMTTMSDIPTTTAPQPTAASTQATTTVDPIHSIVQNVFCANVGSISCAGGFDIICGSDGQYYPNQCELSKAKCKDPTLTTADLSSCSSPGSG